jgi:type VI secretion system protein VasJ
MTALLTPISDAAPAGSDLSYDPEFERLVTEIEKLTSLAGESPDWRFIKAECEATLREKSKDLRVMSWLVAAKANLEGWSGIAEGFEAYVAIARTFWPSLFPPLKRLRARAGQVEWLWGVISRRIAALPTSANDAASIRAIEPLVADAGSFFAEHLQDADPGIGAVRSALREKLKTLPEPAAPPVPAPEPAHTNGAAAALVEVAAPKPVVAPPPVEAVAVDASSLASLDQAQDAARGFRDAMMTLAHHSRKVSPADAWSYRLLRIAAWLTVERAPESEGGKTPLRAPKQQERDLLESLRANGQWDGLLEAAEDAAAMHTFWLDAHRMTALALENKGLRNARDIVASETKAFVDRVSGVAHLLFSNGTPFASSETIDWLVAAGPAKASGSAMTTEDASDALVNELDARLQASTPAEAIASALADADRLPIPRARFRARLAIARRAQTSDLLEVALILYDQLLPEVTPTLESWEPALASELLANHLTALRAFLRNPELPAAEREANEQKAASLFRRLLAVDPHAALRLRG